jgi:MFS family permease
VLPVRRAVGPQPTFDLAGIAVTCILLIALVLGITRIADAFAGITLWPWLLAAVAVLLAVLIRIEQRAAQPIIPVALFANRQLAIAYLLTVGAGFGMGSVIFLTSIANLAYGVETRHAGFVLLPLVISSMLGSMGAGRLLNGMGARGLILSGFALLTVGYGGTALTSLGLWGFLVASMPVGLGVGVVVGGALRSIAIDEAPVAVRGAAQGLINICTAIGTLLSAAAISAVADFEGGGAAGFSSAYLAVAILMLLMLLLSLGLRKDRDTPRLAEAVA